MRSPRRKRAILLLLALLVLFVACVAFDGGDSTNSGAGPPDTMIAAGPQYLVENSGSTYRLHDKNGAYIQNIYPEAGCAYPGGDNRIRYDVISGRWFAVFTAVGPDKRRIGICMGVSASSDPLGTFYEYFFDYTSTQVCDPDFPSIGFSTDKLVIGGGRCFLVISKAAVMSHQSNPPAQFFATAQSQSTYFPFAAYSLSVNQADAFVSGFDSSVDPLTMLRMWRVRGVPGVGNGASAEIADAILLSQVTLPPDAIQQGTSTKIGSAFEGTRIIDSVFRNGILYAALTAGCKPSGDSTQRACATIVRMRNLEVDPFQPTPQGMYQFGTSGSYAYFPAITIDSNFNLITVYNRSSASEYVSIYASGVHGDTLVPTGPMLIMNGAAPYFASRWADISGAAIDPSDQTTAWIAAEYVKSNTVWGTWVSQASKALCGQPCQ